MPNRVTEKEGHALSLIKECNLDQFHGVVVVGGDGSVAELCHGLVLRTQLDTDSALERPSRVSLPLGIIPAGSTDIVACSVHGVRDPVTATLLIVLGRVQQVDMCSFWSQGRLVRYGFSAMVGFGGRSLACAEKRRWMPSTQRRDYAVVRTLARLRAEECELSFVEAGTSCTEAEDSDGNSRHTVEEEEGESWITNQGLYLNISVMSIPGLSPHTPRGLAPNTRLANGSAALIAVGNTSRTQFVKHLKRLSAPSGQLNFPFVESRTVTAVKIRPQAVIGSEEETEEETVQSESSALPIVQPESGSESSVQSQKDGSCPWNIDGQLVQLRHEVVIRIHPRLIRLFGQEVEQAEPSAPITPGPSHQTHHTRPITPDPSHQTHHTRPNTPDPSHQTHHTRPIHQTQYTRPITPDPSHQTQYTRPITPDPSHQTHHTGPSHQAHHTRPITPDPIHQAHHTRPNTPDPSHPAHHTRPTTPGPSHQTHHTRPITPGPSHQTQYTRPNTLDPSHQTQYTRPITPDPIHQTHHTRPNTPHQTQYTRPITPDPIHHTRPNTPGPSHQAHHTRPITPDPSHQAHHTRPITPDSSHQTHHTRPITPDPIHQTHHTRPNTPDPSHQTHHTRPNTPDPSHQTHHTRPITLDPSHQAHHTRPNTPGPIHQTQYTRPITPDSSHQTHHTRSITPGPSHQTHHTRPITPDPSHCSRPITPHFSWGEGNNTGKQRQRHHTEEKPKQSVSHKALWVRDYYN
ncbi:hypothetical protein WMY93_002258 [Mugilogobius chulae]|uniref:DAGKc domain-containing protein n=1 Tax=Mugilogobius chulae TaxID=88201 RepID=A0AAW0Q356_9GOBI